MRISDWSSDVCSSDLGSLTVDRNIDRRRAIRAKAVGRFRKRAQIDVIFLEKASIAEYDCLVVDDADDAFAHGLVDPRWLYEREPAILSRLDDRRRRSEEHTSELQSLMRISYAVFCTKKKIPTTHQ